MNISQHLIHARKQQGLTQEELAERANVTVRTIQRIESGETMPRAFTVKALAAALGTTFEALSAGSDTVPERAGDERFQLKMLCLSCFSYLVIPLVHFLIPLVLLRKAELTEPGLRHFARKVIWQQIYWSIALCGAMLVTFFYNMIVTAAFHHPGLILLYQWPFLAMYVLNAIVVMKNLRQMKLL